MRRILKTAMKTFNSGERGSAFPLMLVMLLLLGLMVPPMMSVISTSLVTGKMYEDNSNELYAADAGVMEAKWLMQSLETPQAVADLFGWDGVYKYTLPEEINGKTVTVEIVMNAPTSCIITSTATGADGSSTTIETRVQDPLLSYPLFCAAGALGGDLKISSDVGIVSERGDLGWLNVYANGDIYMIGGSTIYGDAYYTSGHSIEQYPSSGTFQGTGIECTGIQLMADAMPAKPVNTIKGDVVIDSMRTLGPVCIDGNLTITGSASVSLMGTVWVTGQIVIDSNSVVSGKTLDGALYFMISEYTGTSNAITINGNTPKPFPYKVTAVLYAQNGQIYVGGNASVQGAVVGESLDILGTSDLYYPLPFDGATQQSDDKLANYWKIS